MPSAGGFSQTAINQRAGARTQLSELVTVVLAVACALFLGGLLSDLPEATLASMVVIAVLGLIDIRAFVRFWRLGRLEFWIATVTALSGLVLGLLSAVLIGVVLTLFMVIVELDRVGLTELQRTSTGDDVLPAGPSTVAVPGLLVLRFDGPLYTANVRSANKKVADEIADRPGIDVVVLDLTAQAQLPVTVIDEVRELERVLAAAHVTLWIAGLPPRARHTAEQLPRWAELQQSGQIYGTSLEAVRHFAARRPSDPE
jgi:sulfate permease, SulP family